MSVGIAKPHLGQLALQLGQTARRWAHVQVPPSARPSRRGDTLPEDQRSQLGVIRLVPEVVQLALEPTDRSLVRGALFG